MLEVNVALKALESAPPVVRTGPKGGLIDNPVYHPEARKSHFNSPNGLQSLHRFEKEGDTTRQGLQNEQPWHRMAAFMLNAGRTNSEIALAAGKSADEVSVLRSNRWFQELCATIANNVGEELVGLIQSEAQASIETIVHLRDHAESERVQLAAATTLVEHAHGKPTQKVVTDVTHRRGLSPEEERRQLEEELNNIRGRSTVPVVAEV